ncbi:zinc finger (CCCH-type) family protein / RNA recognition motif (RRM)-containing protein isoform X2 [Wolffia australiana]
MKFDESSLTEYLVKNLEPLTETDPAIVADFIVPLLKKDKPVQELQKLCADNLVEFLGHGTKAFVSRLFKTFEDDDIMISEGAVDSAKIEAMPIAVDHLRHRVSREEENPSVSGQFSDSEEKEISDDDDDDRNHKHRRRDNRTQLLENVQQGSISRPPFRKSNPDENGRRGFQSSEILKEYSPFAERDSRRVPSVPGNSGDFPQKPRMGRGLRPTNSSRFDPSTNMLRPPFGGRGRGASSWNQLDTRFNPIDPLGYASQMPSLLGSGFSSAASAPSTSWGSYGFIPGMPNGCLDPLNPLSLQGALHPTINPVNVGVPRQRCRDFEERGFCLRGDMCPMEHGVNRIVVEDVQSLSQFNLPVSLGTTSILGSQAAVGPLAPVTSSSLLSSSKSVANKVSKPGTTSAAFGVDRSISATAAGSEADVYDPDQPLWSNIQPEASSTCLRLPSPPNDDVGALWETGLSDVANDQLTNSVGDNPFDSLGPAWGRARPSNNFLNNTRRTGMREETELVSSLNGDGSAPRTDGVHRPGKGTQKAQRTLFVCGVPPKDNRKEPLVSHFQKFGKIVNIYIPVDKEKAFVQFSMREEAEAALNSPDAVMGNRFIKLFWANWDNIPDGSVVKRQPAIATVESTPATGKLQQRDKLERKDSVTQKALPKTPIVAGPKAILPAQSKLENLDSLKEELRKKQESLRQKRDEFKRQLEKLQKQTLSTKGESVVERPVKKSKTDDSTEVMKANTGGHQEQQKIQGKTHPREMIISPQSKLSAPAILPSPRSLKPSSHSPGFHTNRFKIDNRPTGFRVISPLPDGLANVDALREHFSSFGELAVVELDGSSAKLAGSDSALIIFTSRRCAEVAFSSGNSWRGHSLQFSWMAPSTTPKSAPNVGELSTSKEHKDCSSNDMSSLADEGRGEVKEAEKGGDVAQVPLSDSLKAADCEDGSQPSDPPADDGHADLSSGK